MMNRGVWRWASRGVGVSLLVAVVTTCSTGETLRAQEHNKGPSRVPESVGKRILADTNFQGGLIVLVGPRDAAEALFWGQLPHALVHGLVQDRDVLQRVRDSIREAGMYGRVSAVCWPGSQLPYAEGMVNVLVVLDERVELERDEIDRVLAPGGTAWVQHEGSLKSYRKSWPDDVDQWSHSRYDATGNAVSNDKRVGPPRFLQWEAWPRWNRGTKTSCLVSAEGRLFYILDDSHFSSSSRTWSLIARDAFNGVQLWRHELPSWEGARGGKKVGPAQVHRRLVAVGNRVYATLGEGAPISVLDAASGEVIRVLRETDGTEEFILSNGTIVALVSETTEADIRRGKQRKARLVTVDPNTGQLLWRHDADGILPLTLAADGKQVVYHDGQIIRGLSLSSGALRWESPPTGQDIAVRSQANPDSPGAEKSTIILAPQFAPTLIMYDQVVAFAGGRQLNVVSAADGRELWRSDYAPSNYSVPVDLFGFGGYLWGPDPKMNMWRPLDDNLDVNAYDPLTGTITNSVEGNYGFRFQHHRCHQMKVVDNKVLAARAGIEFLDTDTGELVGQHWVRGSCFYGILPANGLLYVPPHNCACYVRAKLSGFMAIKSLNTPPQSAGIQDGKRLQHGPAYGETGKSGGGVRPDDWPTYRHDMGRSGCAPTEIGTDLLLGWEADLGGQLTSPVIAGDHLYVASTDAHRLRALDAESGKVVWEVGFNGRIDSPPTVYEDLVLCGCRDGSVHALRAGDGARVWRFRASPEERLIVSRGQLESVWPVSGSVLVLDDTVYFAAGKSSYLDGGIHLYGLDPHTGQERVHEVLWSRHPDGSEQMDEQSVDGFLNDVLSSDGERIFVRHQILDMAGRPQSGRVPHLHSPDGYLGSDTTTRLLWTYAPLFTSPHQGAFYDLRLSRALFPSGRILVEDDDTIYGFGQNHYERMRVQPGGTWALFAAEKDSDVPLDLSAKAYRKLALSGKKSVNFRWWTRVPIHVRAMVKAENILFVAGPRGNGLTSQAGLEGTAEATLLAVSPDDGELLAEMSLPSTPVWDGMAAAGGSLYLALENGQT
ncbi:MAG: PQQ-binding-like beta-propeller repeat protein, partial [Planctomycetota bacterium]